MGIEPGRYELGPDNATLRVKTYRGGVAAKIGHDLVLGVGRWKAELRIADDPDLSKIELTADSSSFEVLEGSGGVKPLTDSDREEILGTIDDKVLRAKRIVFRSTAVRQDEDDAHLTVEGELTIGDVTGPLTARLDVDDEGRATGTVTLTQSDWQIKPYSGLMGALKIRDEVEVGIDARLRPVPGTQD
jgi:polyisoprenoid-binding protein YceI